MKTVVFKVSLEIDDQGNPDFARQQLEAYLAAKLMGEVRVEIQDIRISSSAQFHGVTK